MDSAPGTYILVFRNATEFTVHVGKLGSTTILAGYCAYVGSAFGPGGLNSRVARHSKKNKVHRWHMDYIRDHMQLVEVWYSVDLRKVECLWSDKLYSLGGTCPAYRFGSSDCKCESHFFYFEEAPIFDNFDNIISESLSIEIFDKF